MAHIRLAMCGERKTELFSNTTKIIEMQCDILFQASVALDILSLYPAVIKIARPSLKTPFKLKMSSIIIK